VIFNFAEIILSPIISIAYCLRGIQFTEIIYLKHAIFEIIDVKFLNVINEIILSPIISIVYCLRGTQFTKIIYLKHAIFEIIDVKFSNVIVLILNVY